MAYTKIGRPVSQRSGRYGMGTFGSARFGNTDGYTKTERPTGSQAKVARPTSSVTKVARPSNGFISTAVLLLGALVVTAATAYFVTKVETPKENNVAIFGAASGSGLYPTSTNNFQDGDIINAGDWNAIESYLGTKNSTDTTSISYKLTSATSSDPGHKHTTSTVTGTFGVAAGGTGTSSLTANNVLLGNGTSAVQFVAPGTSGNVLQSNGTTWSSAAITTGQAAFGDGSDGTVTLNSSTTLTSDKYYENLTVATSVVLSSGGYHIFVRDTLTINGTVHANGGDGSSGATSTNSTGGSAGTAGTAISGYYRCLAGKNGTNGGSGQIGAGNASSAASGGTAEVRGVTSTDSIIGAVGGDGGDASGLGGSGGAAGAAASTTLASTTIRNADFLLLYQDVANATTSRLGTISSNGGSSGGGGGGGNGVSGNGGGGGGGGGSGANGCVLYIAAKTIIVGSSGVIQANGGAGGVGGGGAGGQANNTAGGGGGGGGNGGNGGVVGLVYSSLTNNGTIQANGGSGGSGGVGGGANGSAGASSNGASGSTGRNGVVIQIR